MKLLHCPTCGDVRSIHYNETKCLCGKVKANYIDDLVVAWNGKGVLLGFANSSFVRAVKAELLYLAIYNQEFTAFTLPRYCDSVIIETKL